MSSENRKREDWSEERRAKFKATIERRREATRAAASTAEGRVVLRVGKLKLVWGGK